MLAMARVLRTGAKLLLLDEITEGLAPVIVKKLGEVIIELKSAASPSCWWNRTSALPPRWPTAITCSNTARSSPPSPKEELPGKMDWLHQTLGV
jgi:branched-chain amino acid transport system ATP-binding protein